MFMIKKLDGMKRKTKRNSKTINVRHAFFCHQKWADQQKQEEEEEWHVKLPPLVLYGSAILHLSWLVKSTL